MPIPNWCNNSLIVKVSGKCGRERGFPVIEYLTKAMEQLESFRSSLDACELEGTKINWSFDHLVPLPQNNRDHKMAVVLWGTMQGPNDPEVFEGPKSNTFLFETMWGPPVNYVKRISKMFPLLKITLIYDEPVCGFYGTESYFGGECIYEETGKTTFYNEATMDKTLLLRMQARDINPALVVVPGTPFADWCRRTGRYLFFEQKE